MKDFSLNGDSEATINSFSLQKYLDASKNTFIKHSSQYNSFSSRKQAANAGRARKQFTENASLALLQSILTHAHTNCPPVDVVMNDYTKKGYLRDIYGTLHKTIL